MKVCAISDLHGTLPIIGECDVVFICGDLFPLEYDTAYKKCYNWFNSEFADWVESLPCDKVFIIPGNHDFAFASDKSFNMFDPTKEGQYADPNRVNNIIAANPKLKDKLSYLVDEEYTYNGVKIYGTPWCISPSGFAFIDSSGIFYDRIPDCDVLLCHQPPAVKKLGTSKYWSGKEVDYGSKKLSDIIKEKDIKYCFCGHIHSGTHGGVIIDGCKTVFYNVSIKNEDYDVEFPPLYLEI